MSKLEKEKDKLEDIQKHATDEQETLTHGPNGTKRLDQLIEDMKTTLEMITNKNDEGEEERKHRKAMIENLRLQR